MRILRGDRRRGRQVQWRYATVCQQRLRAYAVKPVPGSYSYAPTGKRTVLCHRYPCLKAFGVHVLVRCSRYCQRPAYVYACCLRDTSNAAVAAASPPIIFADCACVASP